MQIDTAVSGPETAEAATGNTGDAKANTSLDAAFEKAYAEVELDDSSFAEEASLKLPPKSRPASENAAPATPEAEATTAEDAGNQRQARKRDEHGRFAPGGEDPAEEPATTALSAPAHWDAGKREAFGSLPAEAQKVVLDLTKAIEAGVTRKHQELSETKRFADEVRSLIDDGERQQLARAGMTETQGIQRLVEANRFFTRDPVGYARFVIEQARLRPDQVFPNFSPVGQAPAAAAPAAQAQPQPPAPQAPADPHIRQLHDTVQSVQSRLDGLQKDQEAEANRQMQRIIDRFVSETDSAGNPVHPHFQRVSARIAALLSSDPDILAIDDRAERLAQAYEAAVYADRELRAQMVESEARKQEAARNKQAEVEKARRAQAPVRSAPAASPPQARAKTIDEALNFALEAHGL